ncbi:hypothetical protein H0H92_000501 [Tricholoma furcatifolium]|nr:hypothetical protein H0H92_000501 [Tricholoma furcatifolium]
MEPQHTVIDKGSVIQEKVHHHVHHIVQPVLEKDTVDQHRIHTRIPINEAIHDIPVTREPQTDGVPFVYGVTGKDGFPGPQEAIPAAQKPNWGEALRTSESFEKGTDHSESPRQDNGYYGINQTQRKNSISVT